MKAPRTPKEHGFQPHDALRLARALGQTKEVRTYRRIQAVLLVARGRSVAEVAEITGCKAPSIYVWVRRFVETHQPNTLVDEPRSGRPRSAQELSKDLLLREVARDPMALGYMSTSWTVDLLATHLKREFGIEINPRTLRRRLHEAGLEWKRPRYVYAEKDVDRTQKKGGSCVA